MSCVRDRELSAWKYLRAFRPLQDSSESKSVVNARLALTLEMVAGGKKVGIVWWPRGTGIRIWGKPARTPPGVLVFALPISRSYLSAL